MEYSERRMFQLPQEDLNFLEALPHQWELLTENNSNWVAVYNVPIPVGFSVEKADIAIRISPGYPDTKLDMFSFYPHLQKSNGTAIPRLRKVIIDGKEWQEWSRHFPPDIQWRNGIDNLETQFMYMIQALQFERERV